MATDNLQAYNQRPSLYLPQAIIYLLSGIMGISITILLLISSSKLLSKTTAAHLKICLGILITDFVVSLSFIIMGLAGLINGEYLPNNIWFCDVIDLLYVGGTYLSIWYVGLMSLERGLLIIHSLSLPNTFWLSIMAIELVYFLIMNLTSIGLNQMGLASIALYCMSTPDFKIGYITLYSYLIMMCISVIITIYSYIGIAIIQRIRAWKDIRELHIDKDKALNQANRTIFKVLFLLGIFLGANGLEIINTSTEIITGQTRSSTADFISNCLIVMNPVINSLILIQFHEPVKSSLFQTYPYLAKLFIKNNNTQTHAGALRRLSSSTCSV